MRGARRHLFLRLSARSFRALRFVIFSSTTLGLTGKLGALGGVQNWTSTAADCCDIDDMDVGDDMDINDEEGVRAESIAQEDVQFAAANLGSFF